MGLEQIAQNQRIEAFCRRFSVVRYGSGDILFEVGEKPTFLLYILNGRVLQTDITSAGDEIMLNMYGSRSFVSLTWLFHDPECRSYFKAQGNVRAYRIPKAELQSFLRRHPEQALAILERLTRGLEGYTNRLRIHLTEKAAPRVALELLTEIKRFNLESQPTYELTMTVQELAIRCGLARETTSRQLARLVTSGHVSKKRGRIIIHNPQHLESELSS